MTNAHGRTGTLAAAIAAVCLATGCRSRAPEPRIAFDVAAVNVGEVNAGTSKEVRFPFRNTGKQPLTIMNVDVSCGCLSPQFPQQVPPGGAGEIEVRFEPQAFWSGKVTKELTVHTNNPQRRSVPLHLDAEIIPYVRVEPPSPLEVEYQRGAVVQRDLRLIPRAGTTLSFKGVQSESPLVKPALRPAAPGDPPGTVTLHLDIGPVPGWGDVTTSLQVGTSNAQVPVLPIAVNLRAPNGPVVDPPKISLPGVVAGSGNDVLAPLRVFTRSGALHIVSVDTGTPLVRAEIEREIPDREYRVTLRRSGEWKPGDVRASIRIRTDDPAFPEVPVPFDALVVQPPAQ